MEKIIWGDSSKETMTWDEADKWCNAQGGRLPKVWELVKAWEEKEEGFLEDDSYWASTETSTTRRAYTIYFSSGDTFTNCKKLGNYVRCILNK